jgi:hypothetical protein
MLQALVTPQQQQQQLCQLLLLHTAHQAAAVAIEWGYQQQHNHWAASNSAPLVAAAAAAAADGRRGPKALSAAILNGQYTLHEAEYLQWMAMDYFNAEPDVAAAVEGYVHQQLAAMVQQLAVAAAPTATATCRYSAVLHSV